MLITVVGGGHVGLVTAASLAALGHVVTIVERDQARRTALTDGLIPFVEPGLQDLFTANRHRVHVVATTPIDPRPDLVFIAVGTPVDGGEPDLGQLRAATEELRAVPDTHVAIRSTLPPGTSAALPGWLGRANGERLSINPEFLREGSAVADFMHPARIVIGRLPETSDEHVAVVSAAYAGIPGERLIVDAIAAELIKTVANGFLALKLSFANEVAQLAASYGTDVDDVLRGIALDPRIGHSHLKPALGFGGSCLPKDLDGLAAAGERAGLPMHVARAAAIVNGEHQDRFAMSVLAVLPRGGRVGLLGLSYKAGTDDLRGSPALRLARRLIDAGHSVIVHDPAVRSPSALAAVPELDIVDSAGDVFELADAIVVATDWPEYHDVDWAGLRQRMRAAYLFDGRNLLDPGEMRAAGYAYRGVGRAAARSDAPLELIAVE